MQSPRSRDSSNNWTWPRTWPRQALLEAFLTVCCPMPAKPRRRGVGGCRSRAPCVVINHNADASSEDEALAQSAPKPHRVGTGVPASTEPPRGSRRLRDVSYAAWVTRKVDDSSLLLPRPAGCRRSAAGVADGCINQPTPVSPSPLPRGSASGAGCITSALYKPLMVSAKALS